MGSVCAEQELDKRERIGAANKYGELRWSLLTGPLRAFRRRTSIAPSPRTCLETSNLMKGDARFV